MAHEAFKFEVWGEVHLKLLAISSRQTHRHFSKNAVCALTKHSRYVHQTYNFTSIHSNAKESYLRVFFYIVDTEKKLNISAGLP